MSSRCSLGCPLPGAVLYTVGNRPAKLFLPREIRAVEESVKGRATADFESEGTGDPYETGVPLPDGITFHLSDCGAEFVTDFIVLIDLKFHV